MILLAYITIWICCTFLTYIAMDMTNSLLPLLIMIIPITTQIKRTRN